MVVRGRPHSPEPPPIVLIVDDDRDTRELYEAVFKLEGFWVADAPDADAAFEQAADLQPDLVITDIALSGRSAGAQLAIRIHALAKTANIPIIAVTGRDASAITSGSEFVEVLQKPVTPEALIAATRRVFAAPIALRQRGRKARERIPRLIQKSERLLGKAERILQRRPHHSQK